MSPAKTTTTTPPTAPPGRRRRLALLEQLAAEWRVLGRSRAAVRSLQRVARRDGDLARLVLGSAHDPPPCPTPYDVVEHMRRARGRAQREEAARLVRILLREAGGDPLVSRMLVQALVPGLITVAGRLRWGRGGDWQDPEDFFAELLSTTWLVVREWSGQDRRYAVLDLLSAIRCRLRRQLFRSKDQAGRVTLLDPDAVAERPSRVETDLEELTRFLLDLRRAGMRSDEVQVLYAHHVLGYSLAEVAALTGRDRRAVYSRRDRGRQRLCA